MVTWSTHIPHLRYNTASHKICKLLYYANKNKQKRLGIDYQKVFCKKVAFFYQGILVFALVIIVEIRWSYTEIYAF